MLPLLLLIALLLSGCVGAMPVDVAVSIDELGWSQRVRPDLRPLTADQRNPVWSATRFSDGTTLGHTGSAPQGTEVISPLYPDIDPTVVRQMRTAAVLWIPANGALRLSYEAMVTGLRIAACNRLKLPIQDWRQIELTDGESSRVRSRPPLLSTQLVANARGIFDPVSRRMAWTELGSDCPGAPPLSGALDSSIFTTDSQLPVYPQQFVRFAAIALERCRGAATRDVIDPPVGTYEGCERRILDSSTCADPLAPGSLMPTTVLKCRIQPDGDTSFRLVYVDPTNPLGRPSATPPGRITLSTSQALLPHIKVVAGERVILRGANYENERCTMPGPSGGPAVACSTALEDRLLYWRVCNGLLPGTRLPPRTICPPPERALPRPSGYSSVRATWRFAVGDPTPPGLWHETFAPGVVVDHVRLFSGQPAGERRYLTPRDVRELRINGANDAVCTPVADAGGAARFDMTRCNLDMSGVNPAWNGRVAAQADTLLNWRIVFQVDAAPTAVVGQRCVPDLRRGRVCTDIMGRDVLTEDTPVHRTDPVYFEFHLRG